MSELTVVSQTVTCDAAPYQVEGRLSDGRWFYFRCRHRQFSLGVSSESIEAAVLTTVLMFEASGFEEDRHIISAISDEEADALIRFLVRVLGHAEAYRAKGGVAALHKRMGL